MQRTVGGGSKGGGVVGGCRFLLSTPSVHIKSSFVRVERMSSAVPRCWSEPKCVVFNRGVLVSPDTSVFNSPCSMTSLPTNESGYFT
jgi:hypothetical protein